MKFVLPREQIVPAALLAAIFAVLLVRLDQPIVENYVGRQIPTAMVARNLERGSGFLRPQLDTGPFPNLFLVEPPIFAALAVGVRAATGLPIGTSGRVVSAMATTLAAWGLWGLVRRREGFRAAGFAVAAFGLFPITVRYGRACQPDMLMLGLLVAGMRFWDDYEAEGGKFRLVLAVMLIALGLAVKIVSAYVLIPVAFAIVRTPRAKKWALLSLTLLPALAWYVHAWLLLRNDFGSRASADNASIWAASLGPLALFQADTIKTALRYILLRAFTPIGFVLAVVGFLLERFPHDRGGFLVGWVSLRRNPPRIDVEGSVGFAAGSPTLRHQQPGAAFPGGDKIDRLWTLWGASTSLGLAMVAGKIHHEYYWLAFAPVAAVGIGRLLSSVKGHCWIFAAFVGLCLYQSASTWRTPAEWSGLSFAAGEIQEKIPAGTMVVAPEALLFAADRTGCRLEFDPRAMTRAAGEWGGSIDPKDPLALVEFYRLQGAKFVADLESPGDAPTRRALHEAIRRRYNVVRDRDGVIIAQLIECQGNAPCPPPSPP